MSERQRANHLAQRVVPHDGADRPVSFVGANRDGHMAVFGTRGLEARLDEVSFARTEGGQ